VGTELTRRDALKAAGAAGSVALVATTPGWARKRGPDIIRRAEFPSAVVAGQPQRHGIRLWTQLGTDDGPGRLRLEIARDPGFRRVVHRQIVRAAPSADRRVQATVRSKSLEPGEEYFYRFETRTTSSPSGRFVTLRPRDSAEPVRVGFFSCQLYDAGYYTAHAGLAHEECDVILCLGDYIYETNGDGSVPDRDDHTSPAPSGHCETLAEYRAKYRLYRSDPDLQAMHASAPFVMTWDDHEVEDNYTGGADGGKTPEQSPERRIPFLERRRNAYRAYFEAMPVARFPGSQRIYRRIRLGGSAEILLMDTRQYRTNQTCDDAPAVPCPDDGGPDHTLLGRPQMEWLKRRLSESQATWKLLASGVEAMSWDSAPGVPLNRDGWDGYPRDRTELGEHVLDAGIDGVSILTGDVHHFAAGTVTTTGRITGRPWATEFVGGSITSSFLSGIWGEAVRGGLATNPHQVFQNFNRRGYGVLEAGPDEMRVSYRSPITVTERSSEIETLRDFKVILGSHDLR
jgi:alkaline phosphatase D